MAKKNEEKKEQKEKEENREKTTEKKQEKQLKAVAAVLLIILAVTFFVYWFSLELKKFEFVGLELKKVKEGQLNFYYTEFPVLDASGNIVSKSPFYFRNDPRKLKNITINGLIQLRPIVVLAPDSEVVRCEDSILAASSLSMFLGNAGMKVVGATTNKTEANETGRFYAGCENTNSQYSLIEFKKGNETRITRYKLDCYLIEVADCNWMPAVERFMIGTYAYARGYEKVI